MGDMMDNCSCGREGRVGYDFGEAGQLGWSKDVD